MRRDYGDAKGPYAPRVMKKFDYQYYLPEEGEDLSFLRGFQSAYGDPDSLKYIAEDAAQAAYDVLEDWDEVDSLVLAILDMGGKEIGRVVVSWSMSIDFHTEIISGGKPL
jgi:hypothetical protein